MHILYKWNSTYLQFFTLLFKTFIVANLLGGHIDEKIAFIIFRDGFHSHWINWLF